MNTRPGTSRDPERNQWEPLGGPTTSQDRENHVFLIGSGDPKRLKRSPWEASQRPRTAKTTELGGPGPHENRAHMTENPQDPARNQPGAAKRTRRTPREGPLRPNTVKTTCFS